jgi:hypothetical protein
MNSRELLILIDNDYNNAYGPVRISKYCDSNTCINIIQHRRHMHPRYLEYVQLKQKELTSLCTTNNSTTNASTGVTSLQ